MSEAAAIPHRKALFPGPPALALALLFCGAGYALPVWLFPADYPLNGPTSPEILNLNLAVAWMGLSHFVFAYAGHARAFARDGAAVPKYVLGLAAGAAALALGRRALGPPVFDAAVWTYFIPHFIKAELHFASAGRSPVRPGGRVLYWFPALAFAFFSAALFSPPWLSERSGWLILGAGAIAAAGMLGRAREPLVEPEHAPYALLAFFLLAEAMVWGTYSKYMSAQFRQGVYAFHIAAASFYHYFRSYGFAARRVEPGGRGRYWAAVVAVNAAIALAGAAALFAPPDHAAHRVFGFPWFTFWVGLHLVASDVFNGLRR
ncbi:MAG: hypothetical protein HY553_10765 [Elusimicrobia bacterium]|nr:hypothetical protein [Elusimicrobiota bacterium]